MRDDDKSTSADWSESASGLDGPSGFPPPVPPSGSGGHPEGADLDDDAPRDEEGGAAGERTGSPVPHESGADDATGAGPDTPRAENEGEPSSDGAAPERDENGDRGLDGNRVDGHDREWEHDDGEAGGQDEGGVDGGGDMPDEHAIAEEAARAAALALRAEGTLNARIREICAGLAFRVEPPALPRTTDTTLAALAAEVADCYGTSVVEATATLLTTVTGLVRDGATVAYDGQVHPVTLHLVLADGGDAAGAVACAIGAEARAVREADHEREMAAWRRADAEARRAIEELAPGDERMIRRPARPLDPPQAVLLRPDRAALDRAYERLADGGTVLAYTPGTAPALSCAPTRGRPSPLVDDVADAEHGHPLTYGRGERRIAIASIGQASRDALVKVAREPKVPPAGCIILAGTTGRAAAMPAMPDRLRTIVRRLASLRGRISLVIEPGAKIAANLKCTRAAIAAQLTALEDAYAPDEPARAHHRLAADLWTRTLRLAAAVHLLAWAAGTEPSVPRVVSPTSVEHAATMARMLARHASDLLRPAALPGRLYNVHLVWAALAALPDPTTMTCVTDGTRALNVGSGATRVALLDLEDAGVVAVEPPDDDERKRGVKPTLIRRGRGR